MSDSAIVKAEVVQPSELELYQRNARIADAVRKFVLAHVVQVGKGLHPEIESWQAIAATAGYALACTEVKRDGGLIQARGVVKRVTDGVEVGEGWGYCDDTEKWSRGKEEYAKRGMAQTRAMSRAARGVFGQVIPFISENIRATPAEEMTGVQDAPPPPPHDPVTGEVMGGDDLDSLVARARAAPNALAVGKLLAGVSPELAAQVRRALRG